MRKINVLKNNPTMEGQVKLVQNIIYSKAGGEELPMTLECKLKSYTKETCRLVGEIVNVSADESILDEEGRITLAKFSPVAYDPVNHAYHTIGAKIADAYTYGLKLK